MKASRILLVERILQVCRDVSVAPGAVFFRRVPLCLLLLPLVRDEDLREAIAAEMNGVGRDMDGTDSYRMQIGAIETAVLNEVEEEVRIVEVLSVDTSWGAGASLCVASTASDDLLVVHDLEGSPSFEAFAFGRREDLFERVRRSPELELPRTELFESEIVRVTPRVRLPWSTEEVCAIAHALTGLRVREHRVDRVDLLTDSEASLPNPNHVTTLAGLDLFRA